MHVPNRHARRARLARLRRARAAGAALLALTTAAGCGREFFREWANQDASEVIFEKTRDPRFRLDHFSKEPPMLSRYAEPYDIDFPPAPPDDHATEALAPAPQWPKHRLLAPAEGTGYLEMLEYWRAQRGETPPSNTVQSDEAERRAVPEAPPAAEPPPQPGAPSPFLPPEGIPGPAAPETSPLNTGEPEAPATAPAIPPGGDAAPPAGPGPLSITRSKDLGVRLAAFQATNLPLPVPPPVTEPEGRMSDLPAEERLRTPAVPLDPNPINRDLAAPTVTRPDLTAEEEAAARAATAELAGILVAGNVPLDEAYAAGLPEDSRPYIINPEQALTLGLINSRAYQFQVENVYLTALSVALQRFGFMPQFYAGMSPQRSPTTGFPQPIFANSFLYRTLEAPGGQSSTLSLGTVAGVGKAFISGANLVTGFANSTVFQFAGRNPKQPTVTSVLPLSLVQPFLRGGGRAVTLEPLTLAERNMVYQVRVFARYRQQFVLNILVGSGAAASTLGLAGGNIGGGGGNVGGAAGVATAGALGGGGGGAGGGAAGAGVVAGGGGGGANVAGSAGGAGDPTVGYLNLLLNLQNIEIDRRNIASYERLLEVFTELIKGEASGLSALQVNQIDGQLQGFRQRLVQDLVSYRNSLDQYKQQLGMPPDLPLIPDRALLSGFQRVFNEIERWSADPRRQKEALDAIVAGLPTLEDIALDGRSILARSDDDNNLENLLLAAERVALENRLDLMNERAQLYDFWRTLRVAANALLGVFNLTLTNQFLTPNTTTNPFGFLDQSKQFALAWNAELPLIRVAERNAFASAVVQYERQRRDLMQAEDTIKYSVRQDVRSLRLQAENYKIQQRQFVLNLLQKDQAQENIIAPPASAAGGAAGGGQANAAAQTTTLIQAQNSVLTSQSALVQTWVNYQSQRLLFYYDLGTMPYDEWEAYYELFSPNTRGTGPGGAPAARPAGPAAAAPGGAAPAPAAAPAAVGGP